MKKGKNTNNKPATIVCATNKPLDPDYRCTNHITNDYQVCLTKPYSVFKAYETFFSASMWNIV